MTTTIRLARLHLVSRRVPASLVALAMVAVALRVALRWTPASGASSVMLPLITAAMLGAGLGWIGPLAYLVVSIYAVQQAWTTPWLWPARPAGD